MGAAGPYYYRVTDSPVINNKPHITLESVPTRQATYGYMPQYLSMSDLFGKAVAETEEEDTDNEEMESSD